jgi:hypothetical protein
MIASTSDPAPTAEERALAHLRNLLLFGRPLYK